MSGGIKIKLKIHLINFFKDDSGEIIVLIIIKTLRKNGEI